MTDDELKAIEERVSKATKGPWAQSACRVYAPGEGGGNICSLGELRGSTLVGYQEIRSSSPDLEEQYRNAAFIAASREDVPKLLAEIRRLRQERDEWRATAEAYQNKGLQEALADPDRTYVPWTNDPAPRD